MRSIVAMLALLALCGCGPQRPPETRKNNVTDTIHGVRVEDPYRWLEDQKSPETRAWIDEQNRYTRSLLDGRPARVELERRITELNKTDVTGMPVARGGRYFFRKRGKDQEQFILYMRADGRDEVLVDPHPLSPEHTISVSLMDVSDDGSLVAYGVREGGADEVALRLMDVATRKNLPDMMPKARYFNLAIKPDKSGFYYSRHGEAGSRVYYHAIGKDAAADVEVFGAKYGPGEIIDADLSSDGRYLLIHVLHGSAADRTEVYVQDVRTGGPVVPIVNDLDARFFGSIGGDALYLHTNWNAPNGRVLAVDLKNSARARWREVVPEGKAVIEGVSLAGGRLFVNYLDNVSSRVAVFEPDGKRVRDISSPSLGSVSAVAGRWEDTEAFFAFSSFHVPNTIYRHDTASGEQQVWSKTDVPVDSSQFDLKQVWYSSKDGTKVPMFLLHRKGLKLDGARPVYLTGYGGFTVSLTPSFTATAVAWAERGGVYAVANLRGGGEFGESWHKSGMLANKQNVFDDFIGAAEWLVKNEYTRPSKLAITGGSNGGLLVGAAITQRPELFQAVVCGYPLLDMVRYHQFLVARFWVPEYGSSENAEQFKYLYAYSPYHRVKPGTKYPAALFVTGDSDTRVAPLHARKMAALMQDATGSDNPVLLLYDTKSGHSGGKPVKLQVEEETDELTFLLWQLGEN